MLQSLICASALILAGAASGEKDADFIPLFDGKDLSQWIIPEGDNGHWKILDGVIDYDARSEAPGKNKNLVSKREFGDFVLKIDWRLKETPYENPRIPYILPDGTHARGVNGKPLTLRLPDSDSGVYLRDVNGKSQINMWCWPIGSGEVYGYRMDKSMPAKVRAGVTPKTQADKPVGEWNEFEITLVGDRLTVVLNGTTVIEDAQLPGIPQRGPLSLQHHGGFKDGKYTGPPSLVQFRNIRIKTLNETSAGKPAEGIFLDGKRAR
ncbi:3-keto-disaccharide hydrolase [Singulisphaera rosea]